MQRGQVNGPARRQGYLAVGAHVDILKLKLKAVIRSLVSIAETKRGQPGLNLGVNLGST